MNCQNLCKWRSNMYASQMNILPRRRSMISRGKTVGVCDSSCQIFIIIIICNENNNHCIRTKPICHAHKSLRKQQRTIVRHIRKIAAGVSDKKKKQVEKGQQQRRRLWLASPCALFDAVFDHDTGHVLNHDAREEACCRTKPPSGRSDLARAQRNCTSELPTTRTTHASEQDVIALP